jgi:hypothetical protein
MERRRLASIGVMALLAVALLRCSDALSSGGCASDQDGVSGGQVTFVLAVDDTTFSPTILKAQNLAQVTLTLKNTGTRPHDLVVDCIATPNDNGCPTTSCFPDAGRIPAVPPDASATTTFVTPNPEGIYAFRSDLGTDSHVASDGGVTGLAGQFIVQ